MILHLLYSLHSHHSLKREQSERAHSVFVFPSWGRKPIRPASPMTVSMFKQAVFVPLKPESPTDVALSSVTENQRLSALVVTPRVEKGAALMRGSADRVLIPSVAVIGG